MCVEIHTSAGYCTQRCQAGQCSSGFGGPCAFGRLCRCCPSTPWFSCLPTLQNVASDFTPNRPLHSKSGTLAYLAPEVYNGSGYLDEADWWSLGVLFFECIYNKVGRLPCRDLRFDTDCRTSETIRRQHARSSCQERHQSKPAFPRYPTAGVDAMSTCHQFLVGKGQNKTNRSFELRKLHGQPLLPGDRL